MVSGYLQDQLDISYAALALGQLTLQVTDQQVRRQIGEGKSSRGFQNLDGDFGNSGGLCRSAGAAQGKRLRWFDGQSVQKGGGRDERIQGTALRDVCQEGCGKHDFCALLHFLPASNGKISIQNFYKNIL